MVDAEKVDINDPLPLRNRVFPQCMVRPGYARIRYKDVDALISVGGRGNGLVNGGGIGDIY